MTTLVGKLVWVDLGSGAWALERNNEQINLIGLDTVQLKAGSEVKVSGTWVDAQGIMMTEARTIQVDTIAPVE